MGEAPPPPMPSLCITGALSQIGRCEIGPGITLYYSIFRPRQLHDSKHAPLIVLHGGPGIPSNYLLPIVNAVTDRAVIFYDQYGCGKSSRPPATKDASFSIALMVDHLRILIQKQWGLKKYHLLGHSFGGILGFEYLISCSEEERMGCQSLILASTPTSASIIDFESKRLYRLINELDDDYNEKTDDPATRQAYSETFCQTHECRLAHQPLPLIDSIAQAGPVSWRGISAISSYEAKKKLSGIHTLLLRGEFDFCTHFCMKGWEELIENPKPEYHILRNCSHYSMLEDEKQFGKIVTDFLSKYGNAK